MKDLQSLGTRFASQNAVEFRPEEIIQLSATIGREIPDADVAGPKGLQGTGTPLRAGAVKADGEGFEHGSSREVETSV